MCGFESNARDSARQEDHREPTALKAEFFIDDPEAGIDRNGDRTVRTSRSHACRRWRTELAKGPASRAPLRERRMEAMKSAMQPFSAVGQAWGGPRALK